MMADLLAVQHQDLVIVVEVLRAPVGGELRPQDRVRRADIDPRIDQPEALGDAVVVAVHRQGRHPQGRERQHRRAGLRPDAGDRLPATPAPPRPPGGQEGEVEAAAPVAQRPSTSRMRGAFSSGHVTPAMAASISGTGASITASQSGKRARNALKARPDSALRVRCDRSDETSSLTGSRLWKYGIGQP